MTIPLKETFDTDKPLAPQIDAEWLKTIANALNSLNVAGGDIDKSYGAWTITVGDEIRGTKELYKVVAAREYAGGVLIEAGSETGGSDRLLLPTWDYTRAHE